MNAHDSERIKGMLESLGLGEAAAPDEADVVVFNTCTIREKPDTRLAAYLGNAGAMKRERPDVVVAVGGCYAEAQRERIFELYPFVDVAFGPGSIPHLGDWIAAGGFAVESGRFGTHEHFAADLPIRGERRFQAWVQVSMGCNSACAYCIVPAVRGREQSRRPGEIVAEVTHLAESGVREITLLGQNVNSWGRDLRPEVETEFGELLRACDAVPGIERIRFTSPHPKDFRDARRRRDRRVSERLRARPPARAVGVVAHPQGDAADVRPRALPATRRDAARCGSRPRPRHRSHRGVPRRVGRRLRGDALARRRGPLRQRLHLHLLAACGDGSGVAAESRARRPSSTSGSRFSSSACSASPPSATRSASVGVEEVLVEGPSRTDTSLARGRTRRNTTVNFAGPAAPGELVDVLIEDATSTTLRGRVSSLVAA